MGVDKLITPERAKELRRRATVHAAAILRRVIDTGWEPTHYFPDEAERDFIIDTVSEIADELHARAMTGTNQPCSVCGIPYRIKKDGTVHSHNGMDRAGFSSGETCPGAGRPPRTGGE